MPGSPSTTSTGCATPGSSMQLAEYLGIHPSVHRFDHRPGGFELEVHAEHAAAAIAAGAVRRGGERLHGHAPQRPHHARPFGRPNLAGPDPMLEWEAPYGLRMPMGPYALAANRHMAQFGTTSEQLAQIAVSTRAWAARNPGRRCRDPSPSTTCWPRPCSAPRCTCSTAAWSPTVPGPSS